MTRVLVADAAENLQFWTNFQLMKAFRRICALVAILLPSAIHLRSRFFSHCTWRKAGEVGERLFVHRGPAADRDGNVFFTDNPNNRIVKWNAADGKFSDWLKPAGRANGTYFDKAGNLLAAAAEKGELWSIAPDKKVTVLATNFGGKLFNGPNDLWIRPDGGVYFTDPITLRHTGSRPQHAGGRPARLLHGARPQDRHACHDRPS